MYLQQGSDGHAAPHGHNARGRENTITAGKQGWSSLCFPTAALLAISCCFFFGEVFVECLLNLSDFRGVFCGFTLPFDGFV